jgi:hypothetical protein
VFVCVYIHTYIHIHTFAGETDARTYTYMHMQTELLYVHTHTHTHTYTYKYSGHACLGHIYIHTHTYTVAMYAAARGMRVHAVDPLDVNIQRMRESRCLNGRAQCVHADSPKSKKVSKSDSCASPSTWGNFSYDKVLF